MPTQTTNEINELITIAARTKTLDPVIRADEEGWLVSSRLFMAIKAVVLKDEVFTINNREIRFLGKTIGGVNVRTSMPVDEYQIARRLGFYFENAETYRNDWELRQMMIKVLVLTDGSPMRINDEPYTHIVISARGINRPFTVCGRELTPDDIATDGFTYECRECYQIIDNAIKFSDARAAELAREEVNQ